MKSSTDNQALVVFSRKEKIYLIVSLFQKVYISIYVGSLPLDSFGTAPIQRN